MRDDAVAITGAGMVSSLGQSAAETWRALLDGRCGARPVEGFPTAGFDCRIAAQLRPLDLGDIVIQPRWERIMGLHSSMLMRCAYDAFRGARLDAAGIGGEEIGFFLGMGAVDYEIDDFLPAVRASMDEKGALDMAVFYARGYRDINPMIILMLLNNVSLCQAAIGLTIQGENAVFSPHADSGAQAVIEAVRVLRDGKARAALAGGVSEKISALSLARAHLQGGVVSAEGVCRPFARDRSGTVLGEGCGILCLEPLSLARARGAPVRGLVTGYGQAFGAEDTAPSAAAVTQAMKRALKSAGLDSSDIDVLIAHGDGTLAGDGNEIDAIDAVFGGSSRPAAFSSKGALGHLLAGAPAVDLIFAAAILSEGALPPTVNAAAADFPLVRAERQATGARRVLVNCRSFEGQCASLVVEAA